MRYKVKLSYDGTKYSGWQKQPKKRTIHFKMAKELLKEAIADAKAVREVALENAKIRFIVISLGPIFFDLLLSNL